MIWLMRTLLVDSAAVCVPCPEAVGVTDVMIEATVETTESIADRGVGRLRCAQMRAKPAG
jgi:hypothetical protein